MAESCRTHLPSSNHTLFGRKSAVAACSLVLIVETWMFLYCSKDWDLQLYHQYAQLVHESSLEEAYSRHTIEYPPLAVSLMLITDSIARQLPDCRAWSAAFPEYNRPRSFANFKLVYRLEMAVITFAIFLLLLHLLQRCLPHEGSAERWERLLTFVLGLMLLRHAAFDRLDTVVGALLLLALGLMLSLRSAVWSFGVLALAIAFKIAPVALAPLWVIGSLPGALLAGTRTGGGWGRLLVSAGRRSLLLAVLTLACFVPFLLLAGPGCLAFFGYHRDRGIEYGSTYAALLDVLAYLTDFETTTCASHGSWDVQSSLSPVLTSLAPLLVGGLLLLVTLLFVVTARRAAAAGSDAAGSARRLACLCGPEFMGHQLLVLLIFLFGNKVFSPQFVLWLYPLAALVPLSGWPRRLFQGGFLGLCLVTAALNPRWMGAVVGEPSPRDPQVFSGPTAFGLALLLTRTLVLTGLLSALALHLVRCPRRPCACAERLGRARDQ